MGHINVHSRTSWRNETSETQELLITFDKLRNKQEINQDRTPSG